ncbi:hypothetical protein QC762_0029360 [Podospora pseudocomata]|uniref:Uncharacterized protein n=1 Tax=Podospora pseudocomata TaxID=2093779 RepID=A0ABR0GS32_9PEZI|nr:hypothetical protein QC762_0029360 [Podospora pseudocomata]
MSTTPLMNDSPRTPTDMSASRTSPLHDPCQHKHHVVLLNEVARHQQLEASDVVVVMAVVDGAIPAFGVDGDGRTIGLLVLLFLMLLCTPDREIGSVASLLESSEPLPKGNMRPAGCSPPWTKPPVSGGVPKAEKRVPSPTPKKMGFLSWIQGSIRGAGISWGNSQTTSPHRRYTPQSPTAAEGKRNARIDFIN